MHVEGLKIDLRNSAELDDSQKTTAADQRSASSAADTAIRFATAIVPTGTDTGKKTRSSRPQISATLVIRTGITAMAILFRPCTVFGGTIAFLISVANAPQLMAGDPKPGSTLTETQKGQYLSRRKAYAPPRMIYGRDDALPKVVTATLDVRIANVDIDVPNQDGIIQKQTLRVRTYNGGMTAPCIRVSPGDILKITLRNFISAMEPDKPYALNKPNGFNITNLHTHGLHVSPEGKSDNVFLEVRPEQSLEYCLDVPPNHTAGTFWFHAHRHGSTALQLSSGMAGALIIDGGLDDVKEIGAAMEDGREKIIVFQQLRYSVDEKGIGHVTENDVYDKASIHPTLINGQYVPTITIRTGEIQRWRCIHGGIDSSLNLAISSADGKKRLSLHEIAADGLPLYRTTSQESILLHPGYRSDFLVQAPPEEGEFMLTSLALAATDSIRRVPQDEQPLAIVKIEGKGESMDLPQPDVIGKYALKPIEDSELFNRLPFQLRFKADGDEISINGMQFDHNRDDVCPRLGTAEEWALVSLEDTHPFHIHVNPFEVVRKDEQGKVVMRRWKDTMVVDTRNTADNPVYVRMRFETYPGRTVLHCHNLSHEDRGMMMAVHILGQSPPTRCEKKVVGLPNVPMRAPVWSLTDPEGKEHCLVKAIGKEVKDMIVIFYLGLGCPHCRSQLEALAKHRDAIAEANLTVVAICPATSEEISKTLQEDEAARAIPFLLLSDPDYRAFKQYGCYDGGPLHGTFLIDAQGIVHFQNVGDRPLMDIDGLLANVRTYLDSSGPVSNR